MLLGSKKWLYIYYWYKVVIIQYGLYIYGGKKIMHILILYNCFIYDMGIALPCRIVSITK
jgi:hypothetical protein